MSESTNRIEPVSPLRPDSVGPLDTATGLVAAYRRREVSPVEIVDEHLARIERLNPALNAFTVINDPDLGDRAGAGENGADGARAAAAASADRWARGEPMGDLDGVPVTVKDLIDLAGFATSEGSAVGSDRPAEVDSPPAARLREAGAVFLGKTTTSEFGWKGMTDTPRFGTTRNPWDLDRSPGGSSGGAAASLAAGIGVLAHGNDGGGSIRIPASYCGLVGLKPTFGRVPQAPVGSPFITLAANGMLTRSVVDTALALNVLSRPDLRDWYAVPHDPRDWRTVIGQDGDGAEAVRGLRFAYAESYGGAEVDPTVAEVCRAAVDRLADLGVTVTEVGPVIEPLRPRLEGYWKAGFASRLNSIPSDRWGELDPGFRQLAQEGMTFDVHDMAAAHAARAELSETMRRFHLDHEVLLTPTMPTVAPPADVIYHSAEFDRWDHGVPFTVPFNYSGQPACSIPVGTVDGMPVGLQAVATHFAEDLLLQVAEAVLAVTIGQSTGNSQST